MRETYTATNFFPLASEVVGAAAGKGGDMARVALVVASFGLVLAVGSQSAIAAQFSADLGSADPQITLPAGTRIELAVTRPVEARTAKSGDPLYMQVVFPATADQEIAVPSGTYVQGRLLDLTKPTRKTNHAQIQVLFTTLIFANGYTLPLADSASEVNAPTEPPPAATLNVQVSPSNDLLLDNGAQLEMTLAVPLTLDRAQIALALPLSRPVDPGKFQSATACRPTPGTPGTPGTPDTVIPGSPGTPSTTIPGGPGMPDIVIPGTPATPDTVIPGMPGTAGSPGTSCPAPPLVIASTPLPLPQTQAQPTTPVLQPQ